MTSEENVWLAAGLRTPFAKIDTAYAHLDAIQLSIPVAQAMTRQEGRMISPDAIVWGTVAPNLGYSNLAREIQIDAGLDQYIPAYSTVMACSTSMMGVIQAAGLICQGDIDLVMAGGVESMSRVQFGLDQNLSDFLRRFFKTRSATNRLKLLKGLTLRDVKLYIPSITNRSTGLSMGEHCELMAKEWKISREEQDTYALHSHRKVVEGQKEGFFDSLLVSVENTDADLIPRSDTNLEQLAKLKPVFDPNSGNGTLTAGNSSPVTDGAAAVWVCSDEGLDKISDKVPRARLVDWEITGVNIRQEGLLMAPCYAIPRMLERHNLGYDDIMLWEIHEAFAAQVLCNIQALESRDFLKRRVGIDEDFGAFPRLRLNPNGGSVAIGHPFGATGARDLSQAVKELAAMPSGSLAVVSICADGGLGTVGLLQAA